MARQSRQSSGTGIYHVMMRGINHQNIFEEQEDYYQFLTTLDVMAQSYDPDGTPSGRNYVLYAYCLMTNHIHLLIREHEESVGETVKRIAGSYVYYYNRKYGRDGHLFKERFKSEPVNDMAYFTVLLRYIHQNPVKAGFSDRVKHYASEAAEATNAVSKTDYRAKSFIALKEARESLYWIDLLHRNNYIDDKQYNNIYADCEELVKILVTRCKRINEEIEKK